MPGIEVKRGQCLSCGLCTTVCPQGAVTLDEEQIAVIGDQIYTDVFGGNRAGALTCYVETLDRRFFWINVRYQLERGFIARGRRRMEARRHD